MRKLTLCNNELLWQSTCLRRWNLHNRFWSLQWKAKPFFPLDIRLRFFQSHLWVRQGPLDWHIGDLVWVDFPNPNHLQKVVVPFVHFYPAARKRHDHQWIVLRSDDVRQDLYCPDPPPRLIRKLFKKTDWVNSGQLKSRFGSYSRSAGISVSSRSFGVNHSLGGRYIYLFWNFR